MEYRIMNEKYVKDPTISDMYGESKNQYMNCGYLKRSHYNIHKQQKCIEFLKDNGFTEIINKTKTKKIKQ